MIVIVLVLVIAPVIALVAALENGNDTVAVIDTVIARNNAPAAIDPPPRPVYPLVPPILAHYARVLEAPTAILAADDDLTIAALSPTRAVMAEPTTRLVLTDGLSRRPMQAPAGSPARVELLAVVPPQFEQAYACDLATSWLVDLLRTLAAYPALRNTWLGAGHTLPIGRPLAPQTDMTGLLLTVPLVLEDQSDWTTGDDPVHLLLVTPLHPGELSLARTQGTGALMNRLFSMVEALGQDWSFFTLPKRPDTVLGPVLFA